ncbi:LacI family DNA-binding transcriptional regulator [Streptomyces sp. NPDC057257]|uniref:LacI family DNA-binding transcriptional regulator n=1 Tax=Streptomyces sp. NPDC057257 TaxID=3346071 RepID=UPI0036458B95
MTMKKLAELAQLDVSTVSRALNGDTARVSAATIARVQELADQHGYRRDPIAATLRAGRSQVIGVLVSTVTDVVMAAIFDAVDRAAAAAGYQAVVASSRESAAVRREALAGYIDRRVDGVIMADALTSSSVPRVLRDSGIPFVMALRKSGNHPAVTSDDHAGGRLVAEHLLALGHHEMAVLAGPRNISTSRDRFAGFASALEEAGAALPPALVTHGSWGVRQGYDAMSAVLTAGGRPTAVFALNDYNAIGAAKALEEHGLRIGTDVALVGYNDVDVSSHLTVPLSSVRNDLENVGTQAAEMLIARLKGNAVESRVLPPRLIVRESSRSVAAAAPGTASP